LITDRSFWNGVIINDSETINNSLKKTKGARIKSIKAWYGKLSITFFSQNKSQGLKFSKEIDVKKG